MPRKSAKPSKVLSNRLKFMLSGPSGVGKTRNMIDMFPNAVIIDTEEGCNQYGPRIERNGSEILQTTDLNEIIEELQSLRTEEHEFKTIIIDSYTDLWSAVQEIWASRFKFRDQRKGKAPEVVEMEDHGMLLWQKANRDHKRIIALLKALDMNIVVITHEKSLYSKGDSPKVIGTTFDGPKGLDYDFDVCLRMYHSGDDIWIETKKQREDGVKFDPKFVFARGLSKGEADQVGIEYIRNVWGAENLERGAEIQVLASADQVKRVTSLLDFVDVPDATLARWFTKAGADRWEEFPGDAIKKCIDYLEKKLPEDLKGGSA